MGKYVLLSCTIILILFMPATTYAAKVVIDAGHGGANPGAISASGLEEKHVNLDIAFKLEQELRKRGYETIMLRQDDIDISLAERVRLTNSYQPDIFVSVHANSHPQSTIRGGMVLYYDSEYPQANYPPSWEMEILSPESKKLALSVLDHMVSHTGIENRGLLPSAAYVIRLGKAPSILVETAFLSNKEDTQLLADDAFRRKMAEAIAMGIEAYMPLSIIFPDTRQHWAEDSILKMHSLGIVQGVNNQFEPDRSITRAEFITLLLRMLPHETPFYSGTMDNVSYLNIPSDLSPNHWAYDNMILGLSRGMIQGYPDLTIRPDEPITRGEATALLDRIFTQETAILPVSIANVYTVTFTDVPVDLWSAASIFRLSQLGFIRGMTQNTFEPERHMTRAEAATLADRLLEQWPTNEHVVSIVPTQ